MELTPSGHRRFVLERTEDPSGVSGVGRVADGVEFADGVVVLRWLTSWPTSVVFHERGMESVEAIHGHDGRTKVRWLDDLTPLFTPEIPDVQDVWVEGGMDDG